MIKQISTEDSTTILQEMCKAVNADYDTMDFSVPQWYYQYSWSMDDEEAFRVWLAEFLIKHKYVGKGKYRGQNHAYYEAGKILADYGWRLEI